MSLNHPSNLSVSSSALYANYRREGILVPQVFDFLQAKNGMPFEDVVLLMEACGHAIIRGQRGVQVEEEPGNGIFHVVRCLHDEHTDDCVDDLLRVYGMDRAQLDAVFRSSADTREYKQEWLKGKPAEKKWFKKKFPHSKNDSE